jgi:hypothetical protein
MFRDPVAAERQLDEVLASTPGFGGPKAKTKKARGKPPAN